MGFTTADKYYLKALDQYPYDMEETMENIAYALSSDGEHAGANSLMAKIYREQFADYEKADHYYKVAMAFGSENLIIIADYIDFLLFIDRLADAEKLIKYAEKLKGVSISQMNYFKALVEEKKHSFKNAVKLFETALLDAYSEETINHLNTQIRRVKDKQKIVKKNNKEKNATPELRSA